jgi:hypothetical protein
MDHRSKIREPLDTIPEEARTKPSGIRSLAPRRSDVNELKETGIPEEIRQLIRNVCEKNPNNVRVKGIDSDPVRISEKFQLRHGGDVPVVNVSRIVFSDGRVIESESVNSFMPERHKICHYLRSAIEGASHIAVVAYSTDCGWQCVFTAQDLTVYTIDPKTVRDFVNQVRYAEEE